MHAASHFHFFFILLLFFVLLLSFWCFVLQFNEQKWCRSMLNDEMSTSKKKYKLIMNNNCVGDFGVSVKCYETNAISIWCYIYIFLYNLIYVATMMMMMMTNNRKLLLKYIFKSPNKINEKNKTKFTSRFSFSDVNCQSEYWIVCSIWNKKK